MERRTFITQTLLGVASGVVSNLWAAEASATRGQPASGLSYLSRLLKGAAIGQLQQVTLVRTYSPAQITLSGLRVLAQQDLRLVDQLIGPDPSVDLRLIFSDQRCAAFGSYSARFNQNGVLVSWQSPAHLGRSDNPTKQRLRLWGSNGLLEADLSRLIYRQVDRNGRLRQSGELTPLTLNPAAVW